jgi:hypothetical protein
MSPKKNIAKIAVGDIVRVVFDDHAEVEPSHVSDPVVFEVFGRILSSNRRSVNIATWLYAECNGDSNIGTVDANCVVYTILRSCMISMHRLLPEPIEPHAKTTRKPKVKPAAIVDQSSHEGLVDSGRNSGTEESSNVPA